MSGCTRASARARAGLPTVVAQHVGHLRHPARVPRAHGGVARRVAQAGESVRAYRLEHVEARLAVGVLAAHQQALVAERGDAVEHVRRARPRGDGRRGVEREAADEHAQRVERGLLVGGEQRVAPVDHVAERAVPRLGVARVGAQQVEPVLEPPEQGARREQPRARRRELEGERESVEAAAHRGDVAGVLVGEGEVGTAGAGALHEQAHRLGLSNRRGAGGGRVGERERGHGELLLGAQAQRLAARHHDGEPRRRRQEPGDERRGVEQVLEAVEHEQRRAPAEVRATCSPAPPAPTSRKPSAWATAVGTRSAAATAASGTTWAPSACRSRTRCASSSARRVLPAPPGPVRVSSRTPRASIAAASASRRSRPTSGVRTAPGAGRRGTVARTAVVREPSASARTTSSAEAGRPAGSLASSRSTTGREGARHVGRRAAERLRLRVQDGVQHRRVRGAGERPAAGERLVEGDA
jgi:hypothetical protein